jgi:hypothetical protein
VFSTLPNGVTVLGGFRDQVILTAILVGVIFALIDERNIARKSNMAPFLIGILIIGIGEAFGANSGWAINPARDFGPVLVDRGLAHRVEGGVGIRVLLGADPRAPGRRLPGRVDLRRLHRAVPAGGGTRGRGKGSPRRPGAGGLRKTPAGYRS